MKWWGAGLALCVFPALAQPLPGPPIDRDSFRHSRSLQNSSRGLVVLPLDTDVLAHSHELADIRVVDAASRQVPYVVEHLDKPLKVNLAAPHRDETELGLSRYRLRLPYETLPNGTRLVITTSRRVFERVVIVARPADERRGSEESEIARAEWRNSDPQVAAESLTFELPLTGIAAIDLILRDGDNAPLPISSIVILIPSYALRFEHPGTALTLLYGNDTVAAPRYDLSLMTKRILTQPAREIRMSKGSKRATEEERLQKNYFWIAIFLAAIILLALFARLIASVVREESRPLGETPRRGDPAS
jgi:hypothetical protein